jgi:vacuolar-type H+-ATPase subunit I/STV1
MLFSLFITGFFYAWIGIDGAFLSGPGFALAMLGILFFYHNDEK